MKYNHSDITKIYTRIVAEHLAQGCILDIHHADDSQGELARIDWVSEEELKEHPSHLYRLLFLKETVFLSEDFTHLPVEVLILSLRYYHETEPSWTVWNGSGDEMDSKWFYRIGKDTYTDDRQEAEDAIMDKATNV